MNQSRETFSKQQKATLNVMSNDDELLTDAIAVNDIAIATTLISTRVVNINGPPLHLHRATSLGRLEIMTLLLDAGADIDMLDEHSHYACHSAIFNAQFAALKLLVERGAILTVATSDTVPLLTATANHAEDDKMTLLLLNAGVALDRPNPGDVLKLVKSRAVFERLVAREIDFTTLRDVFGRTMCHYVALNFASDVRFLVEACGANAVDAVDDNGETPLHLAAACGNATMLRVLVELGAAIDQRDNQGRPALHHACSGESEAELCVPLLLALGADASLTDNTGNSACHRALMFRVACAIGPLVAAGCDLDLSNDVGIASLEAAISNEVPLPTDAEIDAARRLMAKIRLDTVCNRAMQICVGLQPLNLDALQLCEIMMHSFGALGSLIDFHTWWAIATKVKHFRGGSHASTDHQ